MIQTIAVDKLYVFSIEYLFLMIKCQEKIDTNQVFGTNKSARHYLRHAAVPVEQLRCVVGALPFSSRVSSEIEEKYPVYKYSAVIRKVPSSR